MTRRLLAPDAGAHPAARAGLQVTSAASAQEGLAYLAQQAFDLVYFDIRMPDMNGMEALRLIHARFPRAARGALHCPARPDLRPRGAAPGSQRLPAQATAAQRHPRTHSGPSWPGTRWSCANVKIQAQIESLQAELHRLTERPTVRTATPGQSTGGSAAAVCKKRGRLALDLHTRRVTIDGRGAQDLPPTAFDYLLVLVRHSPNVVDYQTLVSEAQGYQAEDPRGAGGRQMACPPHPPGGSSRTCAVPAC